MSEKETKESEKNATDNIDIEPLSDQEMDTVAGGAMEEQASSMCSIAFCS